MRQLKYLKANPNYDFILAALRLELRDIDHLIGQRIIPWSMYDIREAVWGVADIPARTLWGNLAALRSVGAVRTAQVRMAGWQGQKVKPVVTYHLADRLEDDLSRLCARLGLTLPGFDPDNFGYTLRERMDAGIPPDTTLNALAAMGAPASALPAVGGALRVLDYQARQRSLVEVSVPPDPLSRPGPRVLNHWLPAADRAAIDPAGRRVPQRKPHHSPRHHRGRTSALPAPSARIV